MVSISGSYTTEDHDQYTEYIVSSNSTISIEFNEGDTFENALIDITASGAGYDIRCHRDDCVMRNVGVRGRWDYEPSSSPFSVRAPSSTGEILIENVYMPGAEAPGYYEWGNPTGVYVHGNHAGHIDFDRIYFEQHPDNGFYASDPAAPSDHPVDGQGGTVAITNSYVENCGWNFRLGTEGSYAENCIGVLEGSQAKGTPRVFRDYFSEGVEFIDCDAYAPDYVGFNNGSGTWSDTFSCSQVTLTDCRANVDTLYDGSCSSYFTGDVDSGPRTEPEDVGAPTSAEEAASGGYELIEVGAGETYRKYISNGETWENKLIDITASGAEYQIYAQANDFTIRNIGIKGHIDDSSGNVDPWTIRVEDANATARIENVCFEVTCASTQADPTTPHGATGMYLHGDHVGALELDRIYMQNFPDNGFYCSSPGREEGDFGNGTTHISNSYVRDCNTSSYRLGGDGSTIHNSVCVGGSHRGLWQQFQSSTVTDSDLSSVGSDIAIGDSNWSSAADAEVTLHDSRWETETSHGYGSTSNINGTSVGTPQDRVPDGCPTTAEEAASGSVGDTGDEPEEQLEYEPPALRSSGAADGGRVIIHDDSTSVDGTVYEAVVGFESTDADDVGFLFGVDDASTGYDDLSGYMAFLHTTDNLIELIRFDDGSVTDRVGESIDWLTGEMFLVEIDYRHTTDDIVLHVPDSNYETVSATMNDNTYGEGRLGFYRHHGDASWAIERYTDTQALFDPDPTPTPSEIEDIATVYEHDDGFMVWEIDAGESYVYSLGEGEEIRNVLIDQQAEGAGLTLRALDLDDFTVDGVGFLGRRYYPEAGDGQNQLVVSSSTEGVVRNVFIDGRPTQWQVDNGIDDNHAAVDRGFGGGGIQVEGYFHSGNLRLENNYVGFVGYKGSDASTAGEIGNGGGTVLYDNCYHVNCGRSVFQIGTAGSEVRNSVSAMHDPDHDRGYQQDQDSASSSRCLYGLHDIGLEATNSSFSYSDTTSPSGRVFHVELNDDSPGENDVGITTADCYAYAGNATLHDSNTSGHSGSGSINHDNLTQDQATTGVMTSGVPTNPYMAARGVIEAPPGFTGGAELEAFAPHDENVYASDPVLADDPDYIPEPISELPDVWENYNLQLATGHEEPLYGIDDDGYEYVEFAGDSPFGPVEFAETVTQPITVYMVIENYPDEDDEFDYVFYGLDNDGDRIFFTAGDTDGSFAGWAGQSGNLVGDPVQNQRVAIGVRFDREDSYLRIGDQSYTGDPGSQDQRGLTIGGRADRYYFHGKLHEIKKHDGGHSNATIDAEVSSLESKWGIGDVETDDGDGVDADDDDDRHSDWGEPTDDGLLNEELFEQDLGIYYEAHVPEDDGGEAIVYNSNILREGSHGLQMTLDWSWDYSDIPGTRNQIELDWDSLQWVWGEDWSVWGVPFWLGFSVRAPDDYEPDTTRTQIMEMWGTDAEDHGCGPGGGSPIEFQEEANTGEWRWWQAYIDDNDNCIQDEWFVDIRPGVWEDFVVHAEWSHQYMSEDGFIEVWHNGDKIYDHVGNTAPYRDDPPRPPKFGPYKFDKGDKDRMTFWVDSVRYGLDTGQYETVMPRD